MSISYHGTKNGALSLFPSVARSHSRWKKLPTPLAVLSSTTQVIGFMAMPDDTERIRSSGLCWRESRQNATSLRWAIEQSMPRVDSWFSLEHTVTRHPRPGI